MKRIYLLSFLVLSGCDTNDSSSSILMNGQMFVGQYNSLSIKEPLSLRFIYQADKTLGINDLSLVFSQGINNAVCVDKATVEINGGHVNPISTKTYTDDGLRKLSFKMKYSFDQGLNFGLAKNISVSICDQQYMLSNEDLKGIKKVFSQWANFIAE
ncbi:hypothetical protein [Basfia succiniciproducens]|uniref:hypothetical protein n=1 Tax=Basfia succiniciproducens TaxID=653940 RepID=UPI0008CC75C4|nr:hypothetical protein [Basfia succiniciproducens]SEQ65419.1 hypothetical protein SAMN02910415_01836 [Basfia succiniciproducens]